MLLLQLLHGSVVLSLRLLQQVGVLRLSLTQPLRRLLTQGGGRRSRLLSQGRPQLLQLLPVLRKELCELALVFLRLLLDLRACFTSQLLQLRLVLGLDPRQLPLGLLQGLLQLLDSGLTLLLQPRDLRFARLLQQLHLTLQLADFHLLVAQLRFEVGHDLRLLHFQRSSRRLRIPRQAAPDPLQLLLLQPPQLRDLLLVHRLHVLHQLPVALPQVVHQGLQLLDGSLLGFKVLLGHSQCACGRVQLALKPDDLLLGGLQVGAEGAGALLAPALQLLHLSGELRDLALPHRHLRLQGSSCGGLLGRQRVVHLRGEGGELALELLLGAGQGVFGLLLGGCVRGLRLTQLLLQGGYSCRRRLPVGPRGRPGGLEVGPEGRGLLLRSLQPGRQLPLLRRGGLLQCLQLGSQRLGEVRYVGLLLGQLEGQALALLLQPGNLSLEVLAGRRPACLRRGLLGSEGAGGLGGALGGLLGLEELRLRDGQLTQQVLTLLLQLRLRRVAFLHQNPHLAQLLIPGVQSSLQLRHLSVELRALQLGGLQLALEMIDAGVPIFQIPLEARHRGGHSVLSGQALVPLGGGLPVSGGQLLLKAGDIAAELVAHGSQRTAVCLLQGADL
mmetsp:Transcript_69929/g.186296  ORF Transcript_69929/g.186296 Transcript_69929/m.186296 type:complete len:613 (+) Transcript_69929:1069-2907(+)